MLGSRWINYWCNGGVFVALAALAPNMVVATSCFAWQSGARSLAPANSVVAPVPVTSTIPAATFSSPEFSSSGNFLSAVPQNQFPQSVASSPIDTGGTRGSIGGLRSSGIPNASLVDTVFQISDPYSPHIVDHRPWDWFLGKYLLADQQCINRVRYSEVTASDHRALKCYLQRLQATDTRTLNRSEQLAFWFNLYNAKTVDLVLDNYPIRSVRQIKQKLTDFVGPFDDPGVVTVLGKPLSLNDIESGIVRPIWRDPRIHYALNCASYGCPNLSPVAWTAENLNVNLNNAAYQYINSDRAVQRGLLGVRVAKIYKWYKDDFGGSDQGILNHISQYADGNTLNKLSGQTSIVGYFYDWSLNDARVTRRRLLESWIR
jgi:hypothetical protein